MTGKKIIGPGECLRTLQGHLLYSCVLVLMQRVFCICSDFPYRLVSAFLRDCIDAFYQLFQPDFARFDFGVFDGFVCFRPCCGFRNRLAGPKQVVSRDSEIFCQLLQIFR